MWLSVSDTWYNPVCKNEGIRAYNLLHLRHQLVLPEKRHMHGKNTVPVLAAQEQHCYGIHAASGAP
jgi:hypothetical protein